MKRGEKTERQAKTKNSNWKIKRGRRETRKKKTKKEEEEEQEKKNRKNTKKTVRKGVRKGLHSASLPVLIPNKNKRRKTNDSVSFPAMIPPPPTPRVEILTGLRIAKLGLPQSYPFPNLKTPLSLDIYKVLGGTLSLDWFVWEEAKSRGGGGKGTRGDGGRERGRGGGREVERCEIGPY